MHQRVQVLLSLLLPLHGTWMKSLFISESGFFFCKRDCAKPFYVRCDCCRVMWCLVTIPALLIGQFMRWNGKLLYIELSRKLEFWNQCRIPLYCHWVL